jgi:hypothetical protein
LEFALDIRLPVSIDEKWPIHPDLAVFLPGPPTPFTFKMRDAIQAVERHVFVEGLTDNPVPLVASAVAAFTWEFDTYWKVDPANNAYYPRIPDLKLTIEHVARTGELIAEGIALKFLEDRFGISRASCRFLPPDRSEARLDYAFSPTLGTALAVLYPGFPRMRLEVRSRKNLDKLGAKDYQALTRKKFKQKRGAKLNKNVPRFPAGHTIAIYCGYGNPVGGRRPNIILADPGETEIVADNEAIDTTLINYERITARIGLWFYNWILRTAIRARSVKVFLAPLLYEDSPQQPADLRFIRRPRDTLRYKGREFSQRIIEAAQSEESARIALRLIDAGDFGTLTFYGLNVEALELIVMMDWLALAKFLDRNRPDDGIVTGDGVYRLTEQVVAVDEMEAIRGAVENSANLRRGF